MAQWQIDPDHSAAMFSIKHMMVTNIRGRFSSISGTIHFDSTDPGRSFVEAAIDVASVTTGTKKRDEHLLSPDFFDVSNYPLIVFKSSGVEESEGNKAKITGDLTIHGVTRPVSMDVEYFGPVKSPPDLGGETTIGFAATTVINREDYGIMWNVPLDAGLMVGKEVEITLDIEADLAE